MGAAGNHFLQNWQTTLINLAWSLLTFYPVLLQEGPALWNECKGVIFGGDGVDRFDHVLGVLRRLVNIVAGLVATTGIWALIIGAFTGPGEVIVVGAYEAISIGVLAADLVVGLAEMGKDWYSATRDGISTQTRETYLSRFSGSAIAAAITIILVVLGTIASRLARAFKARRAAPAPTPEGGEHPTTTPEAPRAGAPDKLVICRACDIVPGVPADLMARRAALSPEMRAYLDAEAAKIFTDPAHPTPANMTALQTLVDEAAALAGGDLEAGLRQRQAGAAVGRPLTELVPDGRVPSVRGGAFNRWFNGLTAEELERVWSVPEYRESIEARIRQPGGLHEWLPCSRANTFKRWGVTMEQIKEMRSLTSEIEGTNPAWGHGETGSTTAHNEIIRLVDSSSSFADFKARLQAWADTRLVGGRGALPAGLRE
jgi:hypothetical protein